ncbi:MAG: sigma-70 family RNA polymerase sigma factor [Thermoanaerobaculales bacterium]|nr:sigma-70 family RNA polymerase sigma factor [Thermoanaerobaculales bacterium]
MNSNDVGALVDACRKGDPEAWDLFLERYGRLIWSVASRLGANSAEAEEIFQRTWVAVVEGIGRVNHPDRLHSWLASTARHQTWQLFDEQRRSRRFDSLEVAYDKGDEPEIDAMQERNFLALEASEAAHQALTGLDDRCRKLLTLLFLSDPPLKYQEISRRTGLAIGSIGAIRARCLNRLRTIFSGLYQLDARHDT